MKAFRRNMGLYPELWRVRYYGFKGEREGFFNVLVIAPAMEHVFAMVRKDYDDGAIFVSVVQAYVSIAAESFDENWPKKEPLITEPTLDG